MAIRNDNKNDHLLKWLPEFTRDREEAAETPLYKALAAAIRELMVFIGKNTRR